MNPACCIRLHSALATVWPRVLLAALLAWPGGLAAGDSATGLGAPVPYVRYEAEDGALVGGAAVVGPGRAVGDLAGEASGRRAVVLRGAGDGVTWTATAPANALVVRVSIPDSADGAGLEATLGLYIDGVRRHSLVLTSRYAWLYGPEAEPLNDPRLGSPRRIYDESRLLLAVKIAAGSRVMLRKDVQDAATSYGLDFLELELAPPPLPCPGDLLEVAGGSAPADDLGARIGTALDLLGRDGARLGKRGIYIPAGRHRMRSLVTLPRLPGGLVVQGAGMWHSEVFDDRDRQAGWGSPGFNINGATVRISDFAVSGAGRTRGGSGKPFVNGYGTGSVMRNLWIEHMTCGFWVGGAAGVTQGLTITGCRLRNLGADGINLCNGTKNSRVIDTTVRSSGDDGIAIWSAPELDGPAGGESYPGCAGNRIEHCTVELPWRASGFAIYGGKDNTIHACIARDTLTYPGLNIASTFQPRPFTGSTLVEGLLLERCGGTFWSGQPFGALRLMADGAPVTGVRCRQIEIRSSTHAGIQLSCTAGTASTARLEALLEDVVVSGSGAAGISLGQGAGTVELRGVRLLETQGPAVQRRTAAEADGLRLVVGAGCSGVAER